MMRHLGERFRRRRLYFEPLDGTAATCEDFVRAWRRRGSTSRSFRLWYSQAGTPRGRARHEQGAGARLRLAQLVPGRPDSRQAADGLPLA
jgi:aminopeptidase N